MTFSKAAITILAALTIHASASVSIAHADTYDVSGTNIRQNGVAKTYVGANSLRVFDGSDTSDMNSWNIDICREFLGNLRDVPVTGYPVQDPNGSYLRSVETLINNNRANGKVTVLCPFGWDGTEATKFTGTNPRSTYWYNDYKTKMRAIANYIKGKPDVWLEVWNEPYYYNNTNGYSETVWLADMRDMVDNIRSTGANNIVLVPGSNQGQGEGVILSKGPTLLSGRSNIVFDIHVYEGWLIDTPSQSQMENRIQALINKNLAFVFGELGPMNAGTLMDTAPFLRAAARKNVSVMAWLWKYDGSDKDALLNGAGNPNDNDNYSWGSGFLNFATKPRSFRASTTATGDAVGSVTDNNTGTYWSSGRAQAPGQSFVIGLGLGKSWNHIRMDHGTRQNDYPRGWKVYVSDDGANWTLKTSGSGSAWVTDIWPGPQWSKWIKIEQTGTASNWWSIAELTVE